MLRGNPIRRTVTRLIPALCVAAAVGAAVAAPSGAQTNVASDSLGAATRTSSPYLCIPGVDVPTPNRTYPYSFLLSTKYKNTSNSNIRTSVKDIQAVLRTDGFEGSGGPIAIDGSYGKQTKQAVQAFQRAKHLTVDGKVGQSTWKKLSRSCWKFH